MSDHKMETMDTSHQLVVIARLAEYCQYRGALRERDPWEFMRDKLLQIEEPLAKLKSGLLAATTGHLLREMRAGKIDDERYADYKMLFERLLTRGDFADVAIHLTTAAGPGAADWVERALKHVEASQPFAEERKPAAQRSPSWERLVAELYRRLDLDRLGAVLARKPRTAKRKAAVLRRVRRNVAEYCTVVRIPMTPSDTFTPFMLPRIEGVIAANLRFLNKYR